MNELGLVLAGAVPTMLVALAQIRATRQDRDAARQHDLTMTRLQADLDRQQAVDAHEAAMIYDLQAACQRLSRACGSFFTERLSVRSRGQDPATLAPWRAEAFEMVTALNLAIARVRDDQVVDSARRVLQAAARVQAAEKSAEGFSAMGDVSDANAHLATVVRQKLKELPPPPAIAPLVSHFMATPDQRSSASPQ